MKSAKKVRKIPERELLTESYEVRAYRDQSEAPMILEEPVPPVPHAEPGDFQAARTEIKGHGEQLVLPDDCQFGDNDLCFVET